MSTTNFSVERRDAGHWDIRANGARVFAIRGGPSAYIVRDERDNHGHLEALVFKTVQACMAYICDELMFELIIATGQTPITIPAWNIQKP